VSVVEQPNGSVDILVGSIPIVLAGESRGLDMRVESSGNTLDISIRVGDDQSILDVRSGRIGALLNQRAETVEPTIEALEEFTGQLIFQVNRLHAQGQGIHGYDSLSSAYGLEDNTAALNSPNSGIPFPVGNGSFMIHVTHSDTGLRTTHQINVDGDTMSLDDVIDEINLVVGVPNVTAALTVEKGMSLTAAAGYEITFSDDSSDFLASMGINNFFAGDTPMTIEVSERLRENPGLLAAGAGHVPGSNDTALALASLQDVSLDELGGRSLRQFWQGAINDLAVRADAANTAVESSRLVRQSLDAQAQAVSGVSLDEESIKLLSFQRQFQAAARFISVIDETLQTLLSIA
jgi:flagellar hook-associated protein 1 FlgK